MKKSNYRKILDCAMSLVQDYTLVPGKHSIIGDCPFCEMYKCDKCPLSIVKHGMIGCLRFGTFIHVNINDPCTWPPRREFWVKVIEHMKYDDPKKYAPAKLTPETFKFMLDIEDELVIKYNLV